MIKNPKNFSPLLFLNYLRVTMQLSNQNSEPINFSDKDLAIRLLTHSVEFTFSYGKALPKALSESWCGVQEEWLKKADYFGRSLERLLAEKSSDTSDFSQGRGIAALFAGPVGTPAFQLLAWIAESLFEEPLSPHSLMAGEAMMILYFAVRCQDDIADDDAARDLVFLQQVLMGEAIRLLIKCSGKPEQMLDLWSSVMTEFASEGLKDLKLRGVSELEWTEEQIASQGKKYLPMVMPLAALMLRAERSEEIFSLIRSLETLSTGLQLTNDLLGAEHDLKNGERTPYLAALNICVDSHSVEDIPPAIRKGIRSGSFKNYFDLIKKYLGTGGDKAVGLLPGNRLKKYLHLRMEALEKIQLNLSMSTVFSAPVVYADLEITERCNLRCSACFVHNRSTGIFKQLPKSTIMDILEELSGFRTVVHLTGGEPFVHPGVWDILD